MSENKIILVTGGNRGIGLGICKALAKMGHQVLLGARNTEKAQQSIQGFEDSITVLQLDVTRRLEIQETADWIKSKYGRLDALINNAGIGVGSKGSVTVDMSEVRNIMDVNFFGAWQVSQAMIPLLSKSDDGRIVNMSSGMGEWASLTSGYAGYRLSKTALNALTVLMANELSGKVKVNTMCPGWVRTDMGGSAAPRSVDEGADTAVWLATSDGIPSGKFFRDRQEINY